MKALKTIMRTKVNRRWIIERDFQYRYTLILCMVSGCIFLAFAGLILYFHQLNYKLIIDEALIQLPQVVESLKNEMAFLTWSLVVAFLIMICLLFTVGMVITYRIAGPILALKHRLRALADGERGIRLYLRKNDEFRNLQDIFNLAMQKLEESERHSQELIQNHLNECQKALQDKNTPQARECLEQALTLIKKQTPKKTPVSSP